MPTKSKTKRSFSRILSLPSHPKDFVAAMRDSIAVNGVLVPILVDEDRRIIDGVLRKKIADQLEYECPEQVVRGLSLDEKRTMARCVNIARRHLTDEERREIIADQIRESPSRSDRWIARQLGVSHPTVGSIRRQVVNLYHLEKEEVSLRVGLDGKSYPARPMRTLRNPPELRKDNDFYKTPKVAIEELAAREKFQGTVLEPACGDGIVVRTLREHGCHVVGSDILSGNDFLKSTERFHNIVTNPPYSKSTEFLTHALTLARRKVAMLFPLDYLHGKARKPIFENATFPLSKVIVFSFRLSFGGMGQSPTGHGWFIFQRSCRKPPTIEWV